MHHMQHIHVTSCAADDCDQSNVGKSKYCRKHRTIARSNFKAKCDADKAERAARYSEFHRIVTAAHKAGCTAADAAVPIPMVIKGYESSPVLDGVCGFAWVTVRPGNCSFAIWAKKNMGWTKAYRGGVQLWISAYNQSMTRKDAYASAYAEVLRGACIEARAGSRMD